MPINERLRMRSRWPVTFDIEGIPRDVTLRQQKIEEQVMQFSKVQKPAPKDRNKPPAEPYSFQEYPKRLAGGVVVKSKEEEEKVLAKGGQAPEKKAPKQVFQTKAAKPEATAE
ncbi:MAG TPA: hypothetical protein VHX11_08915 [Acidobacteriaceae bacterium]|jgi:hypothetical protein|nr:hypothetical protein [Acidobacteriaceae bacterium]